MRRALSEAAQTVASLQQREHAPPTPLKARQRAYDVRVTAGTETHLALGVTERGVITSAHKNQLGTELRGEREDKVGQEGQVVTVTGAHIVQRNVDIEATPPARPHCVTVAFSEVGPRLPMLVSEIIIVVMTQVMTLKPVYRDEQDSVILIECLLGPISMMDIKIHYQHPLQPLLQRLLSCQHRVVISTPDHTLITASLTRH